MSKEDTDGFPCTTAYIDYEKEGKEVSKEIKSYLETEVDSSLHDFLKGNVLVATRYFNHRVKQFLNEIVMGGNKHFQIAFGFPKPLNLSTP